MQRGEAYFLEAEAENNNGGRCLTKQTSLNWLQKYTWRDEHHPVAPWPVSKALKLLAGIRSVRILICVNGVLKHVNTPDSYLRERCANIVDSVRSLA